MRRASPSPSALITVIVASKAATASAATRARTDAAAAGAQGRLLLRRSPRGSDHAAKELVAAVAVRFAVIANLTPQRPAPKVVSYQCARAAGEAPYRSPPSTRRPRGR